MSEVGKISELLQALDTEDNPASSSSLVEQLVPLVYEELRSLARANRYRWMGSAGL